MSQQAEVTQILHNVGRGDSSAVDRLLPLVYDELRRLAESRLQKERGDHTLQATALVHEAYLRLVDQTQVKWEGRAHFFAIAAQAIRRILVDHARGRKREKRGGNRERVSLDAAAVFSDEQSNTDLLDLDATLVLLADREPDKARVVELKFFGGLTSEEAARVLNVTSRTVERYWQYARAWLYREMSAGQSTSREGACDP